MTKNSILHIIVLLTFCTLQAQEKKEKEVIIIEINSDVKTLHVLGGIVSGITKEDLEFAKKYNIQYHNFGCLAPVNLSDYEEINARVFETLNEEFGTQWQTEIKKGILGFEKWKKNSGQ